MQSPNIQMQKILTLRETKDKKMDVVSSYSFASCGWHFIQAIPLIIWPQAINGLLTINSGIMQPSNDVENYFARSLGFTLAALGLVTVVLTGTVPLDPRIDASTDDISPYAAAVLFITTTHHTASAFYCWNKYRGTDQTGFLLGFLGNAIMASFGFWCVMFGGEKARISKRTGADKRTSGFPFKNTVADKKRL